MFWEGFVIGAVVGHVVRALLDSWWLIRLKWREFWAC